MAKRFGISRKVLRIYKREGLVRPLRTSACWRVYAQRATKYRCSPEASVALRRPQRDGRQAQGRDDERDLRAGRFCASEREARFRRSARRISVLDTVVPRSKNAG
ncbi:MAG: MerR family transcriptional regulator [Methylocella sp.]